MKIKICVEIAIIDDVPSTSIQESFMFESSKKHIYIIQLKFLLIFYWIEIESSQASRINNHRKNCENDFDCEACIEFNSFTI